MVGSIWNRLWRILWAVLLSVPLEELQLARSLEIQQQEQLLELLLVQLREHSAVCLVQVMATPMRLHLLRCIINHLQYIMLHHRGIVCLHHPRHTGHIGVDGRAMMGRFLLPAENVSRGLHTYQVESFAFYSQFSA
jgi:hypothetical protein